MIPPETRTIAPSVVINGWLGDTFWRSSEHLSEIVFLNGILADFFRNSDAFVLLVLEWLVNVASAGRRYIFVCSL